MKYKAYPKYKDSGVEWLGEIPETWSINRGRFCFSLQTEKRELSDFRLGLENIESGKGSLIETESMFQTDGVTFETGDVLFGKLRPYLAKVWVADRQGEAVGDFFVLRPHDAISPIYLGYSLLSDHFLIMADGSTFGAKMPRVDWEFMANFIFPLPPRSIQQAIATFLDAETARIDGLIKDYEELIALLQEKRQALISHAVTRGLSELVSPDDPEFGEWAKPVKFKDSGVEWLGEIPEGWKALRLKKVSEYLTSGPRGWSEKIDANGDLFIQSGDLNSTIGIDFDNAIRVTAEHDSEALRSQLRNDDVVVCITGAKTGNVAVCTGLNEVAYVNQHLCIIRPNELAVSTFLGYMLISYSAQEYFAMTQYGLKQGLNLSNVGDTPITLPGVSEQTGIVKFLNGRINKFDVLKAEAESAIALLKEHRAALITNAVTGKIMVE